MSCPLNRGLWSALVIDPGSQRVERIIEKKERQNLVEEVEERKDWDSYKRGDGK